MSPPSSSDKNIAPFRFFSKNDWEEAAKQELEGATPAQKLSQRLQEVDLFAYYDKSDLPATDFQLPRSKNDFLGARGWCNLPSINATEAGKANEAALAALNSGADGVLFELTGIVDAQTLLEKIESPYCSTVYLTAGGQEKFFADLTARAKTKKYDPATLSGAIFWRGSPDDPVELTRHFGEWTQFHPLGIIADRGASIAEQIAELLTTAVTQLDYLTQQGVKINIALNSIAFSVSMYSDFFLGIAGLKALRRLWFQVASAYDSGYSGSGFIHALVRSHNAPKYQPHENMLAGTWSAMSAILGGCDALTVQPADPGNAMQTRIARNISSILREESHLGKVADPMAGCYYVEKLTDQLAALAWQKFQHLQNE